MNDGSPVSVGLGGDGDEVVAIQDVERLFNVRLDYSDAPRWITAGDVFASLEKVLSQNDAPEPDVWRRFAECLASHTGIDATLVQPGSPLLTESRIWARVADASAYIWIAAAVILVSGAALAFV